jgi:predicted TIM-barrel fold metal-dependent hydrolase
MDSLKLVAQAKLVFESANPNPALVATLAEIANRIPDLTIVVDHLPHAAIPADQAAKAAYLDSLRKLGGAPRVYIKLSEIPLKQDGNVSRDVASYKGTLGELWNIFGEDKVLFGSDWPNSDHLLPFDATVVILKSYAASKSRIAQEKLFWRNSIHAYRWHPRLPNQPREPDPPCNHARFMQHGCALVLSATGAAHHRAGPATVPLTSRGHKADGAMVVVWSRC